MSCLDAAEKGVFDVDASQVEIGGSFTVEATMQRHKQVLTRPLDWAIHYRDQVEVAHTSRVIARCDGAPYEQVGNPSQRDKVLGEFLDDWWRWHIRTIDVVRDRMAPDSRWARMSALAAESEVLSPQDRDRQKVDGTAVATTLCVVLDVRTKSPRGRPATLAAALVTTIIAALIAGGWWASQQGYVSWLETACTVEGYDPVPSYDELVTKYKKSPYCARLIRGETWL